MATKAKGSINLRGRFPAGAKVRLEPRVSDSYSPSGTTVEKTATVKKDSTVSFDGLDPWTRWWAVADIDGATRAVAVTAKPSGGLGDPGLATSRAETAARLKAEAEAGSRQRAELADKDPLAGSPALGGPDPSHQIVSGSRGSLVAKAGSGPVKLGGGPYEPVGFSGAQTGVKQEDVPQEPHPHLRQEDVPKGTPQRSDTITGEATPVEEGEEQPRVAQRDDAGPQRSDTPEGELTPVPDGEVQPSLRQEDVPDGTPQRSDTETGEAEPIPGASPAKQRRRRDSSAERARGRTKEKPREKTTEGAKGARKSSGRKSSGSTKASRSAAAKKAAATRRRNARKSS